MLLSYLFVAFFLNALVASKSAKVARPAHLQLTRRRFDVARQDTSSSRRYHGLLHGSVHAFDLESRQTGQCGAGNKVCSGGCIPSTYTCCSDGDGGCPSTSNCVPGGCCPKGKTCNGVGGGCNAGETDCGSECAPSGGSCCLDGSSCLQSTFCYQISTGNYGCCLNGENCGGGSGTGTGTCDAGETQCGTGCMPSAASCCPDGRYCDSGKYCVLSSGGIYGCCTNGQTCSDNSGGGGGTCDAGETECGTGCMPSSASCCSDGRYCDSGDYCVLLTSGRNGCCPNGETCSGVVGGGDASVSTTFQITSPAINSFTTPSQTSTRTRSSSSPAFIITDEETSSPVTPTTRTTSSRTPTFTTPGAASTSVLSIAGSSRSVEAGTWAFFSEYLWTLCIFLFV